MSLTHIVNGMCRYPSRSPSTQEARAGTAGMPVSDYVDLIGEAAVVHLGDHLWGTVANKSNHLLEYGSDTQILGGVLCSVSWQGLH